MSQTAQFAEGTVLTLKKPHPCGSKEWLVLRPGWEYSLKCLGCGHIVLIRRDKLRIAKVAEGPAKQQSPPAQQISSEP